MRGVRTGLLLLLATFGFRPAAGADPASVLMRFPNSSATAIVFVARGALWTVPLGGGVAHRLTAGPGTVLNPRFSPDGRLVAFTRRRAGTYDVFVVPVSDGPERRLTFDAPTIPGENLVIAWTPDGLRVVFLSKRLSPMFRIDRAFAVPVGGGLAEPLPLDRSGLLSYAPDARRVVFNRVFRNFDTRKRYLGGQHQNLFTYEWTTHRLVRITDWRGTDTAPMWWRRTIYFLSDRGPGFRANLWAVDPDTKRTRAVTGFTDDDVDAPSLGPRTVTFAEAGRLWALDLPGETLRPVPVTVPDDEAATAVRTRPVGDARVTDGLGAPDDALSPDGAALLLSAHGDIFRVATADGSARDLTETPGADEDHPSWSPDGRSVAYVTDRTGDARLAIRPADGSGPERLLPRWPAAVPGTAVWSPRGDLLAVPDANHALWLVPEDGRSPARLVDRDPAAPIDDAAFSPDGSALAWSTADEQGRHAIHLRTVATGADAVLSSPMEDDRDPVFSADGKRLFFVSRRVARPFVSDRDDGTLATLASDGIDAATLDRTDPASPTARAVPLPIAPTTILSLAIRASTLFYAATAPVLLDGSTLDGSGPVLHAIDLAGGNADRTVLRDADDPLVSSDGSRVVYRRAGVWHVAPTEPGTAPDRTLALAALRAVVDPRAEWRDMFEKAWRLDRALFFSAALNGDDWQQVHDRYSRFLPLLGSGDDFLHLLDEMTGELASSHARVQPPPDRTALPPDRPAHLGADLAPDTTTGFYRIARIFRGDAARPGPLAAPGLDIRPGDDLLAIDGHTLRPPDDPDRLLLDGGASVALTVRRGAAGLVRTVTVRPVPDDMPLRHQDWIEQARLRVARRSGDRLGYVFLSDFDSEGAADFVRQFYAEAGKEGLVVDIRWNRGGFLSQAILDVFRRIRLGLFVNRENGLAPLPPVAPPPVLVLLLNEGTASDGDQFAFYFRRHGLGPLVGTRSWGGVQGIDRPWRLMDGTAITIPKDSLADLHGHWLIENTGVAPDIAVDDRPDDTETGADPQLDRAVDAALATLRRSSPALPRAPPPLPAYPAAGNVPGASFGPAPPRGPEGNITQTGP